MKVNNLKSITPIPFADIDIGECFMYNNKFYLKIAPPYASPDAFCFDNNLNYKLDTNAPVFKVNAHIEVDDGNFIKGE